MAYNDNPVRTLGSGRKTVARGATAEALGSAACTWVEVFAETDNTSAVTVGGSDVVGAEATREGIPLAKGVGVRLEVSNLAAVFVDVITDGDGVTFTYGAV
jgi:hypothetical protein